MACEMRQGPSVSSQKRADARTVALAMSDWIAALSDCKRFEPRNRLLAALPAKDLLSLQPHLTAVPLTAGRVLSDVDELLDRVYFVDAGVVSLATAYEHRVTVGVAAVGREERSALPLYSWAATRARPFPRAGVGLGHGGGGLPATQRAA